MRSSRWAGRGNLVLADGRRGVLQKEIAAYLCDVLGLSARPSAGNDGELRLSAAEIDGWLASGKGEVAALVSQGTSEAAGLSDRDKGSWLAIFCAALIVALTAGPVDRDDSDKRRSWPATTGGARAVGRVSQPEEASESAGPARIRSGPVRGPENGRGADSEDGSPEGSSFKVAQADLDPADETKRTGKAPSASERRRRANLTGEARGPARTQNDKRR